MILGVDPEHRNDGHAVLARHLLGELHRRQGLEEREERPAEKAGLLPGDDDDGLRIGEAGGRRSRFGRGAAALLLRGQHPRQLRGRTRMGVAARNRLGPCLGRAGFPEKYDATCSNRKA